MGEGEQEENTINHLKESEDEEEDDGRRVHQVRVLVLGVLYCTVLYCTVPGVDLRQHRGRHPSHRGVATADV